MTGHPTIQQEMPAILLTFVLSMVIGILLFGKIILTILGVTALIALVTTVIILRIPEKENH